MSEIDDCESAGDLFSVGKKLEADLAEALSILDHLYDYDFRMPPDDWWRDDIRPRVAAFLKKHGL